MARARQCDRCGEFYAISTSCDEWTVKTALRQEPKSKAIYDVCPECLKKFYEFMRDEEMVELCKIQNGSDQ